jgi:hypothetical protein
MSSTKNELKTSLKDAKDKCEKLSEANRELKDRLVKVKEDYTKIKIDYDNLLITNDLWGYDSVGLDIAWSRTLSLHLHHSATVTLVFGAMIL